MNREAEIFGPERLEQLRESREARKQASIQRHPLTTGKLPEGYENKTEWSTEELKAELETRGRGMQGLIQDVAGQNGQLDETEKLDELEEELAEQLDVGLIDRLMNFTQEQRDTVRALWDDIEANNDAAWWPNSEDQRDED